MIQTRTFLEHHPDYSKYIFPIAVRVLSLKISLSKVGKNKKKNHKQKTKTEDYAEYFKK